jgi:putative transposase
MVHYRRNFVPGGTFFFTVTLDDRSSSALIDHAALLRAAFRKTRSERPFVTDAIVILPDHLHAILTLPPGDPDFSDRWRRIKGSFRRSVRATGAQVSRDHRGEYSLWQNILFGRSAFGNTPYGMNGISSVAPIMCISIRSSTG